MRRVESSQTIYICARVWESMCATRRAWTRNPVLSEPSKLLSYCVPELYNRLSIYAFTNMPSGTERDNDYLYPSKVTHLRCKLVITTPRHWWSFDNNHCYYIWQKNKESFCNHSLLLLGHLINSINSISYDCVAISRDPLFRSVIARYSNLVEYLTYYVFEYCYIYYR